ncbi:MAG: hypothetical protein LBU04_05130 [Christensenellaceae bacterium]|nr:hypothetical protein [Christensenellaceae bacterium]
MTTNGLMVIFILFVLFFPLLLVLGLHLAGRDNGSYKKQRNKKTKF